MNVEWSRSLIDIIVWGSYCNQLIQGYYKDIIYILKWNYKIMDIHISIAVSH